MKKLIILYLVLCVTFFTSCDYLATSPDSAPVSGYYKPVSIALANFPDTNAFEILSTRYLSSEYRMHAEKKGMYANMAVYDVWFEKDREKVELIPKTQFIQSDTLYLDTKLLSTGLFISLKKSSFSEVYTHTFPLVVDGRQSVIGQGAGANAVSGSMFDSLVGKYYDPILMLVMAILTWLGTLIPSLKNINKAIIALIVFVIIGAINIIGYGGNFTETIGSVMGAVFTWNNFLKKVVTEPIIKEPEVVLDAEEYQRNY